MYTILGHKCISKVDPFIFSKVVGLFVNSSSIEKHTNVPFSHDNQNRALFKFKILQPKGYWGPEMFFPCPLAPISNISIPFVLDQPPLISDYD